MPVRLLRLLLATALSLVVVGTLASPAGADPVSDAQAKADRAAQQVEAAQAAAGDLDAEVARAVADLTAGTTRLEQGQARLRQVQADAPPTPAGPPTRPWRTSPRSAPAWRRSCAPPTAAGSPGSSLWR